MTDARQAALEAFAAGLSVLPPKEDGSKAPSGQWLQYQTNRASLEQLYAWYGLNGAPSRSGCGLVCGAVSGGLECIEFDSGGRLYEHYKATARAMGHGDLIDRLEAGYLEQSPSGGYHWLYRCSVISGSTKLALTADKHVLIETKGEGGYIITAPSNGRVHLTGGSYILLSGGFATIPIITPEERLTLWDIARLFDEEQDKTVDPWIIKYESIGNTSPWDEYNARTNWGDLLIEHGWTHVFTRGDVQYWRRPGKDHSHSATVNYGGSDRLKCFSTSAEFDTSGTYSRFGAYTVWEHGGDWKAAIKALKKESIKERSAAPHIEVVREPISDDDLVIQASKVEPAIVDWLWKDRIPRGFLSLFAGRTGLGKSFVCCDVASRLTRGDPWPDSNGECVDIGNVLVISEDHQKVMLSPRFVTMNADRDRIFYMTWKAMSSFTLGDVGILERACEKAANPSLIMIDPPTNFLGDIDEHKNSEVRSLLMSLVGWLEEKEIAPACVLITHVNKASGKGIDAISRVIGSVAWMTTARVGMVFAPHPENPKQVLLVSPKNNIGELAKGLVFKVVKEGICAKVEWLGEWEGSADDAMNGTPSKPRRVAASEFLVDLFRRKREWPSDQFWSEAKQAGVSSNAIKEAKPRLSIPKARRIVGTDGDIFWVWWVPEDWPFLVRKFNDPAPL